MSIVKKMYLQDRMALYPGRVRLTPVAGEIYDMTLADEPLVEGNRMTAAIIERIEDTAYPHIHHKLTEFLYSNRMDWQAYYSEVLQSMTIITASGVYAVPRTGVYKIICVGGGQGGQGGQGGSSGNSAGDNSKAGAGGAGGAAGGVSALILRLKEDDTYSCTIGAGGAGSSGTPYAMQNLVANVAVPGALGGSTSFGTLLSTADARLPDPDDYFAGGAGGAEASHMNEPGSPGTCGLGRAADINIPLGGAGGAGGAMHPGSQINRPRAGGGGGGGGAGFFGLGGAGGKGATGPAETALPFGLPGEAGKNGAGYGAGGGGGGGGSGPFGNTSAGAGGNGKAGSNGCIFIIEDWGSVS